MSEVQKRQLEFKLNRDFPEQHLVTRRPEVSFPAEESSSAVADALPGAAAGTLHGTPRFMEHFDERGAGSLRMRKGGSSRKLENGTIVGKTQCDGGKR